MSEKGKNTLALSIITLKQSSMSLRTTSTFKRIYIYTVSECVKGVRALIYISDIRSDTGDTFNQVMLATAKHSKWWLQLNHYDPLFEQLPCWSTKQNKYLVTQTIEHFDDTNFRPYIEEEETTHWSKEKVQKDKQRSTNIHIRLKIE
jgi:hypothetical protein